MGKPIWVIYGNCINILSLNINSMEAPILSMWFSLVADTKILFLANQIHKPIRSGFMDLIDSESMSHHK